MRHASVKVLSSYLDGELSRERRLRLERHLEDCEDCRHRLEGLHRVVHRLEELGRIPPAPSLQRRVLESVAGREKQESLMDRLEQGAARLHIERWVWMPTFGMVIALASIIYLFSWGLERQQQGIPVVLEAELPASEAPEKVQATASERVTPVAEGRRSSSPQRGGEAPRLADALGPEPSARVSEIDGRLFELRQGVWIEQGVDPTAPAISLDPAQAATPKWQGKLPNLARLKGLGGPVRLRVGNRLVQLEFEHSE